MKKERKNQQINQKPRIPEEILKATALLYLEDALRNERYEDCAELIQRAKEFGAKRFEVRKVIKGSVHGVKVGRRNSSRSEIGGRLGL